MLPTHPSPNPPSPTCLGNASDGLFHTREPAARSLPAARMQVAEDVLVHLFEECNLCAIHAKRITISK